MRLGSLFSGGGLGDFGFMAAGYDIRWQCEIDEYCQKILSLRYPDSKKYRDIKQLKGSEIEPIDIITGGFPCQPFSVAGKQKGKEDNRYLWPEMLRVIEEFRPRWVVGENVPGIINLALDTVCADLEGKGYEVWPIVFPSHALGAWHKRDRLWIIAYRHDDKSQQQERDNQEGRLSSKSWQGYGTGTGGRTERGQKPGGDTAVLPATVADSFGAGLEGQSRNGERRYQSRRKQEETDGSTGESRLFDWRNYWASEPIVGRVAHGITDRVYRLKMLGNGQVPACTYVIGKMIMDIERKNELEK